MKFHPQNSTKEANDLWCSEVIVNIQLEFKLRWFPKQIIIEEMFKKRKRKEIRKGVARQYLLQPRGQTEFMQP